jgi:hypothetical protein
MSPDIVAHHCCPSLSPVITADGLNLKILLCCLLSSRQRRKRNCSPHPWDLGLRMRLPTPQLGSHQPGAHFRLARMRWERRRQRDSRPPATPAEAATTELSLDTIQRLLEQLIGAANSRGLCLVQLAKLAALPPSEGALLSKRCCCADCWRTRAN